VTGTPPAKDGKIGSQEIPTCSAGMKVRHFSVNSCGGFARVPAWLVAGEVRRPTAG
jgi:hypothetical protein